MSVHYKQPVLLIEFEENKAFSLEVCFIYHISPTLALDVYHLDHC